MIGSHLRSHWRKLLPAALVFFVALICCCLHIARYQQFSPIDELRHLDYAIKISNGNLTHFGDKIGEIAMREEMCRKIDLAGWVDPPCRKKKIDPVEFRDDGWQTASPHPPLYYLGAGLTARFLGGLGITTTYVAGARLFSAFLTALGIAMAFHVMQMLKVSKSVSAATALSVLVFPAVLHSSGIVTPDSASLLVGATIAVTILRFRESHISVWWLAALGVVAGATKLTNLFAASAGSLFLVIMSGMIGTRSLRLLSPASRRQLRGGIILFLSAAATTLGWLIIDSTRATIDPAIIPQNVINHFSGWPPLDFLLLRDTALRWLPPSDGYIQAKFAPEPVLLLRWLLELMCGGTAIAAIFRVKSDDEVNIFVSCTALTALLGAPLFSMASTKFSETLVQVQGRYGLSLLPLFLVGLASSANSKIGRCTLSTFGYVAVCGMIVCLINAPTLR